MSKPIIFWLAILLMFSGAAVVWSALKLAQNRAESSGSVAVLDQSPEGVDWLKDFTLTERSGKKFGSEDLKGNVWVASFFYSSCPGTCRAQSLEIMALQNQFAKKGVKFVSITCDPKTDTLPKLREYADSFHAQANSWYFLTGDIKYLKRIGAEYFQVAVEESMHSDRFMLVDKWGNLRAHIDWKDPLARAEMKQILEQLLAEQSPPSEIKLLVPGSLAPQTVALEPEDDEEDAAEGGDDVEDDVEAASDATEPLSDSGEPVVSPSAESTN